MTSEPPKLFISYSWTDQEHMDWVVQLATDLRSSGVNTILDKWHLREGQDSHAFMEQMVVDPSVSKVILVCDRKYVERADQRLGGVGTESQVMSGEIYGKVDQTKFVAVSREIDEYGRALIPIFMRTRIYIDFVDDDLYDQRFEQLLRWCFNKPLYIEPELGQAPAFSDNNVSPVIRRLADFNRSGRGAINGYTSSSSIKEFFRGISSEEALPGVVDGQGVAADDGIFDSILGSSPIIARVLDVFEKAVRESDTAEVAGEEMHSYLEFVMSKYESGSTSWSGDVYKFYGQFVLVASVAILVDNNKGCIARDLLKTPFVMYEYGGMTVKSVSYGRIGSYLKSISHRNDRLKLRRLSLHGDLIKQVCEAAGFNFRNFIQADLALFLRSFSTNDRWWPDSLVYVSDTSGSLPWYIRATTEKYRKNLLPVIEISNKPELEELIRKFSTGQAKDPQWSGAWSSVNTIEIANLANILAAW